MGALLTLFLMACSFLPLNQMDSIMVTVVGQGTTNPCSK